MSPLSDSRSRALVAFALVFGLGAGWLFAQEQSAATISQQVRGLFERAAKAVVKIHGVDEHSEICGTGFSSIRPGHSTQHTQSEAKRAISQLNSTAKNIRRANSWQTFAAAQPS